MNNDPWIVKTRSGAIWGKIHRVIIDSSSRQIVCVDVMVGDQDQFIRVPWESLSMEDEDIVLGTSEADIYATVQPSGGSVPATVTLEESARPCHV